MRELLRRTRVRLTLVYVAVFAVASLVAASGFWIAFRQLEYAALDASLTAQATSVSSQLDSTSGQGDSNGQTQLPSESDAGVTISAVLATASGTVIETSGRISEASSLAAAAARLGPTASPQTVSVSGRSERVLVSRAEPGNPSSALLILARPIGELQTSLVEVGMMLALGVLLLTGAAASLGYWLAGRALRPVRVMSATARGLSEQDLHRRIRLDLPPGDEIGELADTFNAMLARLEAAFGGLERFTADAAHELRAPLALMRTQVDVTLRRRRTIDEYQASHRTLLEEIDRLARMADHLLLLARADAGGLDARKVPLEIAALLEEVVERWRAAAREKPVAFEAELATLDGLVSADSDLLRRLFDNLLDNALRHTPAGGAISLSAALTGGRWEILIADTGPGVPVAIRENLFERFVRGDGARQRSTGGAGLGLSLCAAIATAHDGSIRLESPELPGARFVVSLKAAG